jgi:hypothetical protein
MTYVSNTASPSQWNDRYLVLLSGVLLGYAVIGKGFAYLGFAPIFIGETVFILGLVVLLRTGGLFAALTMPPNLILAATMAWVLLRTLPFVGEFGFDAPRDSVVIMYGGFAFIVIALLLEDGRRVGTIIRYYSAFLSVFIPIIPLSLILSRYMPQYIPVFYGHNVPLLEVRPGEVAVHLAGATVFSLVGLRRATALQILLMLFTATIAISTNRGAMLALALPVIVAMLALGRARQLIIVLVAGAAAFSAAYVVETAFTKYHEAQSSDQRALSTRQIVDNVASIFGRSGDQTESTKKWREDWWNLIIKDTLYGPHFWVGRGFGMNIADADGFGGGGSSDQPALRSPHNMQMTVLARAGVPGAALWALFVVCWFGTLLSAMRIARRRRQPEWAGLFLFLGCYVMSIIINATFDVALEGPMLGIWFWCLVGLGTGSVMVYRCQLTEVC